MLYQLSYRRFVVEQSRRRRIYNVAATFRRLPTLPLQTRPSNPPRCKPPMTRPGFVLSIESSAPSHVPMCLFASRNVLVTCCRFRPACLSPPPRKLWVIQIQHSRSTLITFSSFDALVQHVLVPRSFFLLPPSFFLLSQPLLPRTPVPGARLLPPHTLSRRAHFATEPVCRAAQLLLLSLAHDSRLFESTLWKVFIETMLQARKILSHEKVLADCTHRIRRTQQAGTSV